MNLTGTPISSCCGGLNLKGRIIAFFLFLSSSILLAVVCVLCLSLSLPPPAPAPPSPPPSLFLLFLIVLLSCSFFTSSRHWFSWARCVSVRIGGQDGGRKWVSPVAHLLHVAQHWAAYPIMQLWQVVGKALQTQNRCFTIYLLWRQHAVKNNKHNCRCSRAYIIYT